MTSSSETTWFSMPSSQKWEENLDDICLLFLTCAGGMCFTMVQIAYWSSSEYWERVLLHLTSYTICSCCSAVCSTDAQTGGLRFQSSASWMLYLLYFHLISIRTEAWTGWPVQPNSLLSLTRMRLLMVCTTNTAWLDSCPSEVYFVSWIKLLIWQSLC